MRAASSVTRVQALLRYVAGVLLAALAAVDPVAARAVDLGNETCLTCHSSHDLTGSSGASVFVDARKLSGSAHARLACTTCHRDARSIPHETRLARVRCGACHAAIADTLSRGAHRAAGKGDLESACLSCHGGGNPHDIRPASSMGATACASCHTRESEAFRGSVHGLAIARGDDEAATCRSCHGLTHSVRRHGDPDAPTSRAHLAATCARCHADRELVTRRRITIPEATTLYAKSVHGRSNDPRAATCNDCHESHRLKRATDPTSSIYRANIAATCGRCHAAESRAYATGIHGSALQRGVSAAPTCTDCHGEHLIRGPHDADSPVRAAAVTKTCAHCHEAEGIRETYGLPAGRLNTYEDSFHGLAARGGSPAVANCASCHGAHEILPSSDPRSAVSPGRLPETCGRCHPGAGKKFALGSVHVAAARPDNRMLFVTRWVYLFLIFGTIGGMVFHNGLDFASKLRRHWRRHWGWTEAHGKALGAAFAGRVAAPLVHGAAWSAESSALMRWFERMTRFERLQHLLLMTSFFTLVFTGFALKFPEAWPFAWLARLEGGYAWRSVIHRGAAVVMVLAALIHVAYLVTRRGRSTLVAMLPHPRDAAQMAQNVAYMMGLRREPPAFDRFGYIEKAEYWALLWGTMVMTVTGVVLWFENQSLQVLSKWMLDLATLVHYYEAWLAFLAILVWHVYQNVINPDVYPMNWTWITGRIGEEQMRHEHRAEWERVVRLESSAAAEGEPGGEPAADRPAGVVDPPPSTDVGTTSGDETDQASAPRKP